MAIVKVIEVIAESPTSWEEATQKAVEEAARTVDGINQVWISSMKAVVEGSRVTAYRVVAKVSFVVKGR